MTRFLKELALTKMCLKLGVMEAGRSLANQKPERPQAAGRPKAPKSSESLLPRENLVPFNCLATTPAQRRREASTTVSGACLLSLLLVMTTSNHISGTA